MGAQWDRGTMGQGRNGTEAQLSGKTMGQGHNGTGELLDKGT